MSITPSKFFPQSVKNLFHQFNGFLAVTFYRNPAKKLHLIGVTGTDGKTTTSTLIYHLLKTAGVKVGLISTVAAYINDQKYDTGFHVTSPDPWSLQKFLRQMKDLKLTHVVLEVTSHGLDQHRFYGCRFQTAVFTNITHEHLDYHKNFNRYVAAKAKLMAHAKTVILNRDDTAYPSLKKYVKPHFQLLTYSGRDLGIFKDAIQTRFPESYNQANAAAMLVVGKLMRLKKTDIVQAISTFPGVPGRLQSVPNQRGLSIFVDFAHTPHAIRSVLTALRSFTHGKLIAVFGAAGLRDRTKRPHMGRHAAALADEVIVTSEDPRSENKRTIIRQILSGITQNHGHVHAIIDRKDAIKFALGLAQSQDTVVILGKGHEQSINLDGRTETPWSDVSAVETVLKELA